MGKGGTQSIGKSSLDFDGLTASAWKECAKRFVKLLHQKQWMSEVMPKRLVFM